MFLSYYNQQLASTKSNIAQKLGGIATADQLKTTAKKITTTAFKIAFIADPLLLPVVQAGLEQLKGLCQLVRSMHIHE